MPRILPFSISLLLVLRVISPSPAGADEGATGSPSETISVTDANVAGGLSPLNWVRGTDFISTAGGGSSLRVHFRGTSRVELLVDTTVDKFPSPSRFPVIAWTVNGGASQMHQLAAGEKSIVLADGVRDPEVDLYAKGFSPFENRYVGDVPDNSLKITGFQVDAGAATATAPQADKLWVNIGDSIMSGDGALREKGAGRPPDDKWSTCGDARASYGYLLANHYGYRESRIAYGGYDWGGGLANLPGLPVLADQITSTVSRLTGDGWQPKPAVVLINLGENGAPTAPQVTDALAKIRLRAGPAAKIVVMIPLSGRGRGEVSAAFRAYKESSHDANAYLLDLGPITYDTGDGQHPTAPGHRAVYTLAVPKLDAILNGS